MILKAGYPFSLISNGLVAEYPKLEKDIRTDIVVMGGGISGALTAWYLIKYGMDCIVVDARTIGLGSTCASTSLLQYEIDTPLHQLSGMIGRKQAARAYHRCHQAIDSLLEISRQIGFTAIQKKQSLYYAAVKSHIAPLRQEYEARKQAGFHVRWLGDESILAPANFTRPAILSSHAAQTDAYLYTHALYKNAILKGLQVYDRTPIISIKHTKQNVELITRDGYRVKAKKLIYATGYEAVNYIDERIVHLKSTYATISEPLSLEKPYWKNEMMIWNTADPYLYMRIMGDRIIVGGHDENFYSPAKRDKLIGKKTKQLSADIRKLFPHIPFIPEFSWTGTFGSTKDGLPYIGIYPKLPNGYFALGFGGNGIVFSLVAAELISTMLKGKKDPDSHLFGFNRL